MEFDNDFAQNVITFNVDNSSTPYTDNRKNELVVISEQPAER